MNSQLPADPAADPAGRPSGEPRWLDDDEQKAWRAWLYSTQLLQDRLDRDLTHETGISHAYYEILVALSETPERMMRMSELADRCLSSRSRLSHAVSRLEERGWVRRRPAARRRAVRQPTPAMSCLHRTSGIVEPSTTLSPSRRSNAQLLGGFS